MYQGRAGCQIADRAVEDATGGEDDDDEGADDGAGGRLPRKFESAGVIIGNKLGLLHIFVVP